ncbi:MAG: hypothetical protein JJT85_08645 [Chromatiales bacterium]|nr:hypothetical protein [Chromatiales bacterium]
MNHLVTVLTSAGEPLTGIARNLSAGGIYLDDLSSPLHSWEFVELLLAPPGSPGRLWRWPALVLRSGSGSAALMFDRLRFDDLQYLMACLDRAENRRSRGPLSVSPLPSPGVAAHRLH